MCAIIDRILQTVELFLNIVFDLFIRSILHLFRFSPAHIFRGQQSRKDETFVFYPIFRIYREISSQEIVQFFGDISSISFTLDIFVVVINIC